MAKYLLLKHYRGAPAAVNDVPMDQWKPEEVEAHIQFMNDFAARLESSGEFIDGQALSPDGMWVRSDGEGQPPVTDGPFAETKDLIAGWMVIDVDSHFEPRSFPPGEHPLWELRDQLPSFADVLIANIAGDLTQKSIYGNKVAAPTTQGTLHQPASGGDGVDGGIRQKIKSAE